MFRTKRTILLVLVASLPGGLSANTASAADDADACFRIADVRGSINLTLTAGIKRATGKLSVDGQIMPSEANGGSAATPAAKAYVWAQCREAASFTLSVRKRGKKVATFRFKTFSDAAGKLVIKQSVRRRYATLRGGDKVSYHLTGLIWDKDQTVTAVDESDSLRAKKTGTVVVRIK